MPYRPPAPARPGAASAKERPIAVDLFSGAGGLSLGFEQAGFDVVAAVEQDAVHAAVHRYNFPHTAVLNSDVRRLDVKTVRKAIRSGLTLHGRDASKWNGTIDAIIAGPPCQGFSLIGRRDAQEHRNKLVYEFARLVIELRPRYFVMENVPGMRLGDQELILNRLTQRLRKAGYKIVGGGAQLLNAADFNVPQDRKRLFLVGARRGVALPKPVAVRKRARVTVWDAIGDIPDVEGFVSLIESDMRRLSDRALALQHSRASRYASTLIGLERDRSDLSYRRLHDPQMLTSSMRTLHEDHISERFRATEKDSIEPVSRFHRLPMHGLANTLRAGTGRDHGAHTSARPIHPTRSRVITVREAARLHSFPDWFRFHVTKWHGFRQVGNSVPPLLARAVAKTLIVAMNLRPAKPRRTVNPESEDLLSLSSLEAKYWLESTPHR